jgi:serine/threonine protein kinase
MIGQTISRYRLDEKLGEGGVGVVYRAFDLRLHRMVALKMLRPELASNVSLGKSLATEAHAASALNHPGIATLYDFETDGAFAFLVYEFIKGKTLRDIQQERSLSLDEVLSLFVSIADGVAAAHEAGIIHRDLKPENVMLNEEGRVKILDFGLAKLSESRDNQNTIPTALTAPGLLVGTVAYMSPEQLEGDPIDHRTDIFAIGTMLCELATGTHPFKGRSPGSTIGNILKEEPASWTTGNLPAELERVIRKCVRKKKQERYKSLR